MNMEHFEKVEKLRQRANVSYEEAKQALEACEWDMLEAMVYLEKLGKVVSPQQESYTTSFEGQPQYVSVPETVRRNTQYSYQEGFGSKMKRLWGKMWKIGKENYLRVSRKGEEIIKIPVWVFVLALLFAWHTLIIIMLVSLFLECHYSFCGRADLSGVNDAMEKASTFADKVKDEYNKL